MKMKLTGLIVFFLVGMGVFAGNTQRSSNSEGDCKVKLNLKNLKQVAEVDERYQSVNVEMCEVIGGDFWIPYNLIDSVRKTSTRKGFDALKWAIPPVNLYEKKLRMLAAALGPTYIRVSGTWANTTYFQDNDEPKLAKAPKGYENVLTRAEWKGVIDFCKVVDGKLVTSFAISDGMRDDKGNWTPAQIEPLINYTNSIGGEIVAAEMFNEPNLAQYGGTPKGYNAINYSRDFAAFINFIKKKVPKMQIMGPGSLGEGGILNGVPGELKTDSIFAQKPFPQFDIFSYHYYGDMSKRCMGKQKPEKALSNDWLSRTELGLKYYEETRNKFLPGKPIWLSEAAEASCGGNPWAATYLDTFRYLEQLGRLAKKGVQVVMHNTLCASEYALLDSDTHNPRPNYWAALLWNRLMGTQVFDAVLPVDGVDVFAHNLKGSKSGLAVLIVNPKDSECSVDIPVNAEQYLLTADGENLQTKVIKLNGTVLKLNSDDSLPAIKGQKIRAGEVQLPAHSILFLTIQKK